MTVPDDVVRDIMRKDRIKGNIDDYLQTVSDADIMEIHARVMEIYRMRKKKRKSTIDMLEREGTAHAQAQADRLKEEQKQEDAAVQEVQEH